MDNLVPVAVALGSNLGNRAVHLDWAVSRLRDIIDGLRVSAYLETAPEGGAAQPDFLNAAVAGHTSLPPRALLEQLLALETERGRVRCEPGAPRELDLDLILYGSSAIDEPGLTVPHPRFRTRAFVLKPLAEIAPGWIDPGTGKTIADLAGALG
ncbi:MAG: 2-amino-4-hydroxy-6-hydroxymethyldihydropteridine diphosphokinase [Vicinamibacterales bacterium]